MVDAQAQGKLIEKTKAGVDQNLEEPIAGLSLTNFPHCKRLLHRLTTVKPQPDSAQILIQLRP
jgi:hypothetical protein